MTDFSRAPVPLFKHQAIDAERMIEQPYLANFSEMGTAKTATTIHAACALFERRTVHNVLVVAPAQCKSVWLHPELGEIQKHAWQLSHVIHYNGRQDDINLDPGFLNWLVCSYEFLRQGARLQALMRSLRNGSTMLVMDESLFVKSPRAIQTRHLWEVAQHCKRRYLLNGTPHGGRLEDTYAQFKLINPGILECDNYYHFRARYCVLGGFQKKQIVAYKNQEDYARRTKPYVIRRLKEDCLDIPPKLYTHLTVALEDSTWKRYQQMRDDLITYFSGAASEARHAPVKAIRLSQLTSGFIGGIRDVDPEEWQLYGLDATPSPACDPTAPARVEDVSSEKLDAAVAWLKQRFEVDPCFRVLVWSRFRRDVARLWDAIVREKIPTRVLALQGGQPPEEREEVKREGLLGSGPCVVLGNPHAGGFGITMITFHNVAYYSCDYSLPGREQSEDRCHRAGQTNKVLYTDFIATGPDGQQTIDGVVLKALRKKENLLSWTSKRWQSGLLEE